LFASGQFQDALDLCQSTLNQPGDHRDALYLLGRLAQLQNQHKRALQCFRKSIQTGHPEAAPHAYAALSFLKLNEPGAALDRIRAAGEISTSDAQSLGVMGSVMSLMDRHEEACALNRKATEADPDDAALWFNYGTSLLSLGEASHADMAYQTSVKLNPDFLPSHAQLALTGADTHSDETETLETLWSANRDEDAEGARQLAHGIARIHERQGNKYEAMAWLERAKAPARSIAEDRIDAILDSFTAAEALCETLNIRAETDGPGPVFIVGMPRTGTTLTDRILSSHSAVESAGERPEFPFCLAERVEATSPHDVDSRLISGAAETDLVRVGERYLKHVSAIVGTSGVFTDKLPIGKLLAPAMLSALPNSRVICLRRHPADSVLSVYRQFFEFAIGHYHYALSLDWTARYVARFHKLIDTFVNKLPETRFRVVDYEDLAQNTEATTRSLLDFAGLEFEQSCLDFHLNAAPVATASLTEVRKPIYTSSIGRWKSYAELMQPALDILVGAGVMDLSDLD
tara:strand:+ start:66087 stop:67634 length:1548 start_codon:yes stop_codon:yes gene_type:complete